MLALSFESWYLELRMLYARTIFGVAAAITVSLIVVLVLRTTRDEAHDEYNGFRIGQNASRMVGHWTRKLFHV
jgi:hypothetical protein